MKKILWILLISVLFTGCNLTSSKGDDSSNKTPSGPTMDESLRGNWIYIDDATSVYVDENFPYPITKIDSNLISIIKDGSTYHLMRSGINNTTVTGDVYENRNARSSIRAAFARKGLSGIGRIKILLQHARDKKVHQTQELVDTGKFEFDNVKSGDYKLVATTDNNLVVQANVDVEGEEINLGSFKLVTNDGYNFKADLIVDNSDGGYFYGNQKQYTGKLRIKNIGSKKGTGLNFFFAANSGYVAEFDNDIVLGTVNVGEYKEVPFRITFNVLDKVKATIPLEISISDVNNNQWFDTVFFHVYQTPMDINIKTKTSNIKGYIIAPGHKLAKIDTSNSVITLPYREGKKYFIVLSNPNINSETPYSIGIDTDTLPFDDFRLTSAHEPNNKESQAAVIKYGESIVSYLHEGDIDYFEVDMSSSADVGLFSPPQIPFK